VDITERKAAARRLAAGEAILSTDELIELLRLAGRERERDYKAQRASV
jgi:hypothetical protein